MTNVLFWMITKHFLMDIELYTELLFITVQNCMLIVVKKVFKLKKFKINVTCSRFLVYNNGPSSLPFVLPTFRFVWHFLRRDPTSLVPWRSCDK